MSYGYIQPGDKMAASARRRRIRQETGRRNRSAIGGRRLFLEQRQFPLSRYDDAARNRALRASDGARAAKAAVAGLTRDLDRRRAVRARAEEVDRLCGTRANKSRRRHAGRSGLV